MERWAGDEARRWVWEHQENLWTQGSWTGLSAFPVDQGITNLLWMYECVHIIFLSFSVHKVNVQSVIDCFFFIYILKDVFVTDLWIMEKSIITGVKSSLVHISKIYFLFIAIKEKNIYTKEDGLMIMCSRMDIHF